MLPVASERHMSLHLAAVMFRPTRNLMHLSMTSWTSVFRWAGAVRHKENRSFWNDVDWVCRVLAHQTASRRVHDIWSSHTARFACRNSYIVCVAAPSAPHAPPAAPPAAWPDAGLRHNGHLQFAPSRTRRSSMHPLQNEWPHGSILRSILRSV